MKIQCLKAKTSDNTRIRRNYGKGPCGKGRADVERVDSAEKSLGEVTQQMRAMFYDYQRIFMTQTVLSASSCGTVFLHSDASPRVRSRAGKSAFVRVEVYCHMVNNSGA